MGFRPLVLGLSLLVVALFAGGCGGNVTPGGGDGTSTDGTSATNGGGSGDTTRGASSGAAPSAAAGACCPPDTEMSGCMHLGGKSINGACPTTCDFWCSTNWRIEKDSSGCDTWRYDMRSPAVGENSSCQARPTK